MAKAIYQVRPGRALGQLYLGAPLQETLARLKKLKPERNSVGVTYSSDDPTNTPILVTLYTDGIRLRFDGAEQRLRLIEVIDFSKSILTYNGHEIFRPADQSTASPAPPSPQTGPSYRAVAKLFGPTFPPEFIPDAVRSSSSTSRRKQKQQRPPASGTGSCILSYPGVAFQFPISNHPTPISSTSDTTALLTSSSTRCAASLCIFHGRTWEETRGNLFQPPLPNNSLSSKSQPAHRRKASAPASSTPYRVNPDFLSHVKVYGQGRIHLIRSTTTSSSSSSSSTSNDAPVIITLSETTPQDLIAELGPPDAIYHKSDRRLSIHQGHAALREGGGVGVGGGSGSRKDDGDGRSNAFDPEDLDSSDAANTSYEHFYNYFRHGIDILISRPAAPSRASPTMPEGLLAAATASGGIGGSVGGAAATATETSAVAASTNSTLNTGFNGLVATKLLLHANIPGSYNFGRYARCRWSLEHVPSPSAGEPVTSEMKFGLISERMREVWYNQTSRRGHGISGGGFGGVFGGDGSGSYDEGYDGGNENDKAMLLQRGWMSEDLDVGFGLGGSAEVVGHGAWEEGSGSRGGAPEPASSPSVPLSAQQEGQLRVGVGDDESRLDASLDEHEQEGGETTRLFGFPGLVFEVLESGVVGCLTVC